MTKRILHMLVGTATLLSCYSNLMAAETGTINSNAKAYLAPEKGAQVSLRVYEGEEVTVNQAINDYYEIIVDDEVVYIEKEYVEVELAKAEAVQEQVESVSTPVVPNVTTPVQTVPVENTATGGETSISEKTPIGEQVVAYAKQFIGTPYVTGGNSLTKGVDCSGFTQQVYKNFGVNLERVSRSQYALNGYAVSKSDLKPGDLVFYGYTQVFHVAIYVGDGQIIHAPVPGKSVSIAPLWQRGDAPIMGYKRIFKA